MPVLISFSSANYMDHILFTKKEQYRQSAFGLIRANLMAQTNNPSDKPFVARVLMLTLHVMVIGCLMYSFVPICPIKLG